MYTFSRAVHSMHSEDIKTLMKRSSSSSMISFAGGMPHNDLFPVKQIEEIFMELPEHLKKLCFQYGPTSGFPPLVRQIGDKLAAKGIEMSSNKVLVTTGSLQAISLVTQEFVNEGDIILTESPRFVGALSVFETYGAEVHGIPMDSEGIDLGALADTIDRLPKKPKFLYVTPNFHNPAGMIYSLRRKRELLDLLSGTDIILLEDDAYGDLYFEERDKPLVKPLKSFDRHEVDIIYTGSFSKILGPGFRLGYLCASREIYEKAETVKQAMDACTSNFTQILASAFLDSRYAESYLEFLRKKYFERKELLQKALKRHMPGEVVWVEPKGGFYIWLRLPAYMDGTAILDDCLNKGVVFITGRTFDPAYQRDDRIRLAFSNMPVEDIEKGVRVLSEVIRDQLRQDQKDPHALDSR